MLGARGNDATCWRRQSSVSLDSLQIVWKRATLSVCSPSQPCPVRQLSLIQYPMVSSRWPWHVLVFFPYLLCTEGKNWPKCLSSNASVKTQEDMLYLCCKYSQRYRTSYFILMNFNLDVSYHVGFSEMYLIWIPNFLPSSHLTCIYILYSQESLLLKFMNELH